MATVINNPTAERTDRVVEVERSDASGWIVAAIILIAVIGGLVWWFRYQAPAAAPPTPAAGSANINVTLPAGGAAGEGSQGGAPSGNAGGAGQNPEQ
jgi:hypothetical protein